VTGEEVGEGELTPHLPEAGVDIEKHAQGRSREQLLVVQVTHHVEEEIG